MKKRLLVLLLCASMVVPTNAFADTLSDNAVSENTIDDTEDETDAVSEDEVDENDVVVSKNDVTDEVEPEAPAVVEETTVSENDTAEEDITISEDVIVSENTVSDDAVVSENEVEIEEVSENEINAEGAGGTSFGSATWLSLNSATTDYLPDTSPYERWYKVSVPSNGVLSLSYRSLNSNSSYFYAELYNAGAFKMYQFGSWYGGDPATKNTTSIGINPGVYYIRVYNGARGSSNQYLLGAWYSARSNWETEFNNSLSTADPIALNTVIGGNHVSHYANGYSTSDVDYYKVYVNKTAKYQIQSSHISGSGTTYFSLYTAGAQCLINSSSFYSSDTSYGSEPVYLTKGYYYIGVSGYSSGYYFKLAKWGGVPTPKLRRVRRGYYYYYNYYYYNNSSYATVYFDSIPGVNQYEIQFSQNKSFRWPKWTTYAYSSDTYKSYYPGYYSSKKKKWWVRMRARMYYNGKYYYSKWSKKKSVRINAKDHW